MNYLHSLYGVNNSMLARCFCGLISLHTSQANPPMSSIEIAHVVSKGEKISYHQGKLKGRIVLWSFTVPVTYPKQNPL